MKDPNMKYQDYEPNRTTRQIRADMELIQAMRPYGMNNRRRNSHKLHIYAICAATFAAVMIIIAARA